jgi:hypothetical protein
VGINRREKFLRPIHSYFTRTTRQLVSMSYHVLPSLSRPSFRLNGKVHNPRNSTHVRTCGIRSARPVVLGFKFEGAAQGGERKGKAMLTVIEQQGRTCPVFICDVCGKPIERAVSSLETGVGARLNSVPSPAPSQRKNSAMESLDGYIVWGRWELKRKFRFVTGKLHQRE